MCVPKKTYVDNCIYICVCVCLCICMNMYIYIMWYDNVMKWGLMRYHGYLQWDMDGYGVSVVVWDGGLFEAAMKPPRDDSHSLTPSISVMESHSSPTQSHVYIYI